MLLALLGNSMQAQNKLYGTVENNGKPLPYVTVRLLETDSTFVSGVTTDTLGKYVFSNIEKGNYLVALSSIGYKPAFIQIKMSDKNLEVPLVTLETENVVLGEVVVKGSSFIRKDDHVLVIPDKQQVKHASTGYDLLYNLMIPSIEVNKRTGTVSTFGGEVSLYINGEKADYRDVQSLRPRDIENVEYYDVPTGKYANNVAAINYVTKQYERGGYIALDGKQTIGYLEGDYNVGSKIEHGTTSYSFWSGYTMIKNNGSYIEKSEKIVFPDYNINRNTKTLDANVTDKQEYIQFKVNDRKSKRNLSAQISLVCSNSPEDSRNDLLNYSGFYEENVYSSNQRKEKNIKPSVQLYGDFNLSKRQTLNLSLKGGFSQNSYSRYYSENNNLSLTDANEDLYSFDISAKYNIKLKNHNSFGIDLQHHHKVTSALYDGDYLSWQHLWMGETMCYINYFHQWKKLNLIFKPGFSWLNYKLHNEAIQRHVSLRMGTVLFYNINKKNQLAASLNIGNDQPDISYINNVNQTIDFLQIKRGNPYLNNTKIYVAGLVYKGQFNRLNMQLTGAYTTYINNITVDYFIEDEKLISTYCSDRNMNQWWAALAASYRVSDNLRLKFTAKYFYTYVPQLQEIKNNSTIAILDINYFWKDFSLNIYGSSATSKLNRCSLISEKSPATYGASVSWSHKGWYIEAGTENPFTRHSRYREHADYGVYLYNQVQTSRIYQRTGYVKLAYTFDFGRKTSRDKNDVDRSINSAIMKAN